MENTKKVLTLGNLYMAAKEFCMIESQQEFLELAGKSDGKAVGTFIEHRLKDYLSNQFNFTVGNSASGIDLPSSNINTDIKATSIKQPQSSCPYKSPYQKVFGLGYNLLVLVYEKIDLHKTSKLNFVNCTFIDKSRTADYTMSKRLTEMKKDGADKDDILGYFYDIALFGNDDELDKLADDVLIKDITQGYLSISNAMQWRLNYNRVIKLSNSIIGVNNYDYKN